MGALGWWEFALLVPNMIGAMAPQWLPKQAANPTSDKIYSIAFFTATTLQIALGLVRIATTSRSVTDLTFRRRFRWASVITYTITLTLLTSGILYYLGLNAAVAKEVAAIWKSAGPILTEWVGRLVNIVFSGIVGNFGWDYFKRKVLKYPEQQK
jgi:hypothetical protein